MKAQALFTGLVVMFAVACGGDDEASKVSTDKNGNGVNTSEASCCLNGSFYDCNGDGDLAQACFDNFDPGKCERDSSKDDSCKSDTGSGGGG